MPVSRRRLRVAAGLWLALGLFVWNVIFDYEVRTAADRYLYLQGLHAAGRGPSVGVDAVMRPATTRGALVATAWSGALVAAGLVAVNLAARQRAAS